MKKFLLFCSIVTLLSFQISAQNVDPAEIARDEITPQSIKEHLDIIASDAMEGRETATPGLKKAAQYIQSKFEAAGISFAPGMESYEQKVLFEKSAWGKTEMVVNGSDQKMLRNFYAFAGLCKPITQEFTEISFVGYGIQNDQMDHYQRSPKSNVALAFGGVPKTENGTPVYSETETDGQEFIEKAKLAKNNGIDLLFIIDENFKQNAARFNRFILNPRFKMIDQEDEGFNGASLIFISPTLAENMFGKKLKKALKRKSNIIDKKNFKSFEIPVNLSVNLNTSVNRVESQNLAGYIEGNDPELKHETLIISAHYDHLGKRGSDIYNGADDNGSGTSTVLRIAETLSNYKALGGTFKRSIQILFFTGEEKGLLGSEYYVNQPLIPLENTIADLNVDMIGRVDKAHLDNENYVYVIGSDRLSMDLHEMGESVNRDHIGLDLDYTFNKKDDPNRFYYRSDHFNFAKNNIPVIFYFSGVHEDYHQPGDTSDKIMFDKISKIGRLCFLTALEVINADNRPQLNGTDVE
jgi:hypothetical protein